MLNYAVVVIAEVEVVVKPEEGILATENKAIDKELGLLPKPSQISLWL